MSHHARLLADARARWDVGGFDPSSPAAQATLSRITATPVASVPRRRNRTPRRLAAAVVAGAAAVSVAAITMPGATPDVIAQAASALPAEGITFSGELRYGDAGDAGETVRVEGSQKGPVASLSVPGGVPGGLDEARNLGHRLTFFQVALPELRELLERAGAGEDDSVRVAGETTVEGRAVYELRIEPDEGASWTLYVDRESYLPVRFEQADPSGSWATLDFDQVVRMRSGK